MKNFVIICGIWSALVGGLAGCASGGFKLTRQYAGFVNRQNLILRIILYIFTYIVFAVTVLIDLVVFNTIDFWEGRVSAGDYNFEKDGKMYAVHHRKTENGLRESRIEVFEGAPKKIQEVLLRETAQAEIEVIVDGVLKAKVDSINSVPEIQGRALFKTDVVAASAYRSL